MSIKKMQERRAYINGTRCGQLYNRRKRPHRKSSRALQNIRMRNMYSRVFVTIPASCVCVCVCLELDIPN